MGSVCSRLRSRTYQNGNKKIKDADGNVIRTEQAEVKVKVWQRVPCGGKLTIDLVEGVVSHRAPDGEHPEVRVQGTVRDKNANGDRLVTLFLVNAQQEPEENKDAAWIFQPELIVRAASDIRTKPFSDGASRSPAKRTTKSARRWR